MYKYTRISTIYLQKYMLNIFVIRFSLQRIQYLVANFPNFIFPFFSITAAAARKPEATEQGSTLIGTNIYVWGLSFSFLAKCKALWLFLWAPQCNPLLCSARLFDFGSAKIEMSIFSFFISLLLRNVFT